jgi:hypothetical protein
MKKSAGEDRVRKSIAFLCLTAFIFIVLPGRGYVQETRIIEEEKLRELEEEIPFDQQMLFDWGVWLRYEYANIHDEAQEHAFNNLDARFWLNFNVQDVHQFYARFRFDMVDFNSEDAFDGDDYDVEGPNLDQAFWRMNVSNFLEDLGHPLPLNLDLSFRFGRQFMYLGRGIAYSRIDEGFEIMLENYDFSLKVIAARTPHHDDDFDTSRPNPNRTDRLFLGSQFTFKGLRKHYPYVFVLVQEDENREDPNVPFQDYDYNSQYYGVGIYGQAVSNLRYWGEYIFQVGTDFGIFESQDRDDIDAQALDVGLEYYFQARCKPRISFEYAWAEGDPDRFSVTETMFGHIPGSYDTQFLGFGYLNTGYSFAPLFANIQFIRLGGSCRPLAGVHDVFDEMETGFNYFVYWKDEETGAVSDVRADTPNDDVGSEIDLYLNWRILSDVSIGFNAGIFYPGDAFSEDDQRIFMLGSVTYSF